MLTKGMVMLICGGLGLIGTIIWIVVDVANKGRREEMRVKMATKNMAGASAGIKSFEDATGSLLPETTGSGATESIYLTNSFLSAEGNGPKSGAFLTEAVHLGKGITSSENAGLNDESTAGLYIDSRPETEGLFTDDDTEGLSEALTGRAADETEAL
ncbi:MAG: hypothetical protein HPY50_01460 [Firmicutes bacterium]|nr:hypothetical protein [Bacillota bacterium]